MDELKIFGALIGLFVLLFALIFAIAQPLNATTCREKWAGSGIESQYSAFGECQIRVNGAWIPEGNYRVTTPAK